MASVGEGGWWLPNRNGRFMNRPYQHRVFENFFFVRFVYFVLKWLVIGRSPLAGDKIHFARKRAPTKTCANDNLKNETAPSAPFHFLTNN